MVRWCAIVGIGLIVAACATRPPPVGPEVLIRGVTAESAKPAVLNVILNGGWAVKSDSASSVIVEKRVDNLAMGLLLGTGYGFPTERLTFVLADTPAGARVVVYGATYINAGSGFEREIGDRSFEQERLRGILDEVATAAYNLNGSEAAQATRARRR